MAKSKTIAGNRRRELANQLATAIVEATDHLKDWGIGFDDHRLRRKKKVETTIEAREAQPEFQPEIEARIVETRPVIQPSIEISEEDINNLPVVESGTGFGFNLLDEDEPPPVFPQNKYGTVFVIVRFVSPDGRHKFAMVYNRDRAWPSFPGGGCEKMEDEIAAAKRETFEEIGILTEEDRLELFGQIQKPNGYLIALLTVDRPMEEALKVRPGVEQLHAWPVSAPFIDELLKRKQMMPDHGRTWQFYKSCFPDRI